MTLSLFDTPSEVLTSGQQNLLPKEGEVYFYSKFFDKYGSDRLFKTLLDNISWQQDKIKYYGNLIDLPRMTAWYGDGQKSYIYSGIPMHPLPWTPALIEIKNKIEAIANVNFSSVLLNRYRNGKDSVAWHCDDEPELGINPIIGSVSLGATRMFKLRNLANKSLVEKIELTHGSFLLMKGETQHKWEHEIPKTSKHIDERINLTFASLNNMYEDILQALYKANNLHSKKQKEDYLQSLKEPAKALRSSYQNQFIQVDYSNMEIQSAYMLRYFPQYSEIIDIVLERLHANDINIEIKKKQLNCALFGSGPCPEALGIAKFSANNLELEKVICISYDINANDWTDSRTITSDNLIPSIFDREYVIRANEFDLTKSITDPNFIVAINKMNLVVFQNCLNEVNPAQYKQVLDNLNIIHGNLRENALLIIIDLANFRNVLALLRDFQKGLDKKSIVEEINGNARRHEAITLLRILPDIVTKNLLDGTNGLIPRRYIDYHTLVIRK